MFILYIILARFMLFYVIFLDISHKFRYNLLLEAIELSCKLYCIKQD